MEQEGWAVGHPPQGVSVALPQPAPPKPERLPLMPRVPSRERHSTQPRLARGRWAHSNRHTGDRGHGGTRTRLGVSRLRVWPRAGTLCRRCWKLGHLAVLDETDMET